MPRCNNENDVDISIVLLMSIILTSRRRSHSIVVIVMDDDDFCMNVMLFVLSDLIVCLFVRSRNIIIL